MSISDLATVASLLASIAVIITVIYLARQVKQNTVALRAGFITSNNEIIAPLVQQRDVAEIWVKGSDNFRELDPVDQQRVMFFESRAITVWNHYFHMRDKGLIEDYLWEEMLWLFRNIGKRESMQETWKLWRSAYLPGFREFMDQYLLPAE